jgi:hypothetical protein
MLRHNHLQDPYHDTPYVVTAPCSTRMLDILVSQSQFPLYDSHQYTLTLIVYRALGDVPNIQEHGDDPPSPVQVGACIRCTFDRIVLDLILMYVLLCLTRITKCLIPLVTAYPREHQIRPFHFNTGNCDRYDRYR